MGVTGGEGGGGGTGGGGGEGVAKPQRSSRASSARRRPLLSLGKDVSVASDSLLDITGVSLSLSGLQLLSVTD